MTDAPRITVEESPDPAARAAVRDGLAAANLAAHGRRVPRGERWVVARDAAGEVTGGAKCALGWGWLYVDWLWVAEAMRGQGLGALLLAEAEALARREGCVGVHLHTISFQAPGFYRRQGYEEVARLADMPPGATHFWFTKRL
ncbi:GNAT family N-acetyltransferase [Siccirubricoccus sp. KC 17139]|uniref:GNAT family N-acetyltransferase n=1 Tax=Siccirubricoccus soli TaxID=2899147 RepID=A0ABT1D9N4_9PROT|nr:GNAT family N-acetyltransferase [Siccirubricoccus soli]MCO6418648.1 GNAT family N-acetyltransferase [Siccirubricoccus soli]MCP2684783.1 GNAT family N-acetyltransferase [Siccirubricoccus soli]